MNRHARPLLVATAVCFAACVPSSDAPSTGGVDAGFDVTLPPGADAGSDTSVEDAAGDASTGDGAPFIDCAKPTGGPTQHQGTIQSETWTADKSPHVVPFGINLSGTLTIEPCAEVLIGEGKTVVINATGKLVAAGLATKPIHIGAVDPSKPFGRIQAGYGGTMHFAYTTIDHGGDPSNSVVDTTGVVYAQGVDQNQPSQPTVFVDHVTIAGSKSNGVTMLDGAGFAPGSQDLTVTGSAQYPVALWARALSGLPTGNYTGNATDEILLDGSGGSHAVHEDTTMHNRGVPYRVGNSLSGSGATLVVERQSPSTAGLATLTIEAGVKVRVKKGGTIYVQRFAGSTPAQGALVVNGTAAAPVVFTSAEPTPAPGDWYGIWFGLVPAANNKIDYARVEYAGAASGSSGASCNLSPTPDAAIRIFGLPASSFVTNTTIVSSARHGIDRGWRDDSKPDFLATNTFVSIAGCKQTYPSNTNGSCPSTVPCP